MFVWLVADGWCWFVLREKYCWLVVDGWFVVREKYCWLVADKPNEQGENRTGLPRLSSGLPSRRFSRFSFIEKTGRLPLPIRVGKIGYTGYQR
jgi:hypothetical protein